MAIPEWQFSWFPCGKWWTPVVPCLWTPGRVLAAPSTDTAMERAVTLVLSQEGISAPFIMKKYAWLGFPRSCWLQRGSFAPKFALRHPSQGAAVTPMQGVLGGQHETRGAAFGATNISKIWRRNPGARDAAKKPGTSLKWVQLLFLFRCFKIKATFSISSKEILLYFYLPFWSLLHQDIPLNFHLCQWKMLFHQHQNIWRMLADISACKCVWGAFVHLFAWKKYGFNWLSSRSLFRRYYQNTGWESQHKALKETRADLYYRNWSHISNQVCM